MSKIRITLIIVLSVLSSLTISLGALAKLQHWSAQTARNLFIGGLIIMVWVAFLIFRKIKVKDN
jgi:hypothetical protein